MNYSKIGWTQKTAITQSDLTHMDEGIYELAAESSETKSRVEQLRFSNIQAGVYFFGSDTTADVGSYTRGTTSSTWTGSASKVTITNAKGSSDTKNIQIRPTKIVVTVLE